MDNEVLCSLTEIHQDMMKVLNKLEVQTAKQLSLELTMHEFDNRLDAIEKTLAVMRTNQQELFKGQSNAFDTLHGEMLDLPLMMNIIQ